LGSRSASHTYFNNRLPTRALTWKIPPAEATSTMAAQAVEGLSFSQEKKNYIVNTLDPILEQMVQECLLEMPADVPAFMLTWLQKRSGLGLQDPVTLRAKRDMLKKELASMKEFVVSATDAAASAKRMSIGADSDEESDDDDMIDEPIPPPEASRKPRASVSAEVYGEWNKARPFVAPQHPKTPAQTEKLRRILTNSFMFANLEEKDLQVVLLAMVERTFSAGKKIITEGEDGEVLFVIEEGNPICKKWINGQEKVVKQCRPGDVFGELALLYNSPRAATVEAVDKCICWELDRETFTHIVKEAATKQTKMYESFLEQVSLFATLDKYERSQICDALKTERFGKGQAVVREGEEGNKFYIVEEGELAAIKSNDIVKDYRSGDYFGELALLNNEPRKASVVVTSATAKVLSLDRKSFTKMLGPLQELLRRKAGEYK